MSSPTMFEQAGAELRLDDILPATAGRQGLRVLPLEPDLAAALAEIWDIRDPIPPDRWAERYFELSDRVSAAGGRFDFASAPHVRGILQLIADPAVAEITLMMASQTQKTTILEIIAFWIADQNPGPTMIVWPTRAIVDRNVKGRLRPAIAACARVNRLVGASSDATSSASQRGGRGKTERSDSLSLIRFLHNDLFIVWSQSESQRRSTPAMFVIIDEFESCDSSTLADARDRVSTFGRRGKIIKAGVPGIAAEGLDQQYRLSDQWRFWRPCPAPYGGCGCYQVFTFAQLKWEGGFTCSSDQAEATAYVECSACGLHIRDHHKGWMNSRGVWANQHQRVVQGTATAKDPDPAAVVEWVGPVVPQSARAGVHFDALLAPLLPLGKLAAEWHECKGVPSADLVVRRQARGYTPTVSQAELETLRARRLSVDAGGYRLRTVPAAVLRLFLLVDVQNDVVWWSVIGLTAGDRLCLIDHGMHIAPQGEDLTSIDALADLRYPLAENHPGRSITADGLVAAPGQAGSAPGATSMRVSGIAIDEGHRAREVHKFRRRMLSQGRTCFTVKGWDPSRFSGADPYKFMYERTPAGQKISEVPVGILVNSAYWKSHVAQRLTPDPLASAESLAWTLPEDVSDGYLVQLTAEKMVVQKSRRGPRLIWECKSGRSDNHYWDLLYYAACVASAVGAVAMRRAHGLVWPEYSAGAGTVGTHAAGSHTAGAARVANTPQGGRQLPPPPPTRPKGAPMDPRDAPRRHADPVLGSDSDPLGHYR